MNDSAGRWFHTITRALELRIFAKNGLFGEKCAQFMPIYTKMSQF